jgi:hypothetical protein
MFCGIASGTLTHGNDHKEFPMASLMIAETENDVSSVTSVVEDTPPADPKDDSVFYVYGGAVALHGHGKTGVTGRGTFAGVHGVGIKNPDKPEEKGIGILGVQGAGKLAGKFKGDVVVEGDLRYEIQPNTAKPSLQLHCTANLAGFFEEFGEKDLPAGGSVKIEFLKKHPDFNSVTNIQDDGYHVYLTPCGDCKGLFITERAADSFTVKELQSGNNAVHFLYRIVAPRRI